MENIMNITVLVDEHVAHRASEAAQKMGKTLDQLVHDYVNQLAVSAVRSDNWEQFEARCLQSKATLGNWKFNRDDGNERWPQDLNAGESIGGVRIINPFTSKST